MTSAPRTGTPRSVTLAICLTVVAIMAAPRQSVAQLRPGVSDSQSQAESRHSPNGALWRAVAVPGWGQVYNRQFIKLPFLYAAIGGLTYLVVDLNSDYLLYRRAFLYKSFQELVDSGQLPSNPNEELKPSYDQLVNQFGDLSSGPIRSQRDNLRRNRDLSIVGIGLVYGLSILDAYISAHLLDFDVGEDLTVSVLPAPSGLETMLSLRF